MSLTIQTFKIRKVFFTFIGRKGAWHSTKVGLGVMLGYVVL